MMIDRSAMLLYELTILLDRYQPMIDCPTNSMYSVRKIKLLRNIILSAYFVSFDKLGVHHPMTV
uniref:Uncharacterized protein n=1 Tax=Cyanothece sp. (strain PCC 7425 / ATCC 29141) TaxID=395961 RepID=B8HSL4_CYAP4